MSAVIKEQDPAELFIDWLQSLPYEKIGKVYADLMTDYNNGDISREDLAYIAKKDRYFLLTVVFARHDALHPWLYDRCREVEKDPDGHLDLWSRGHYKNFQCFQALRTPSGVRLHGELQVGEYVYSPEGKPVKILAKTGDLYDPEMYYLTFFDQNNSVQEEIHCGSDHLWDVEFFDQRRISGTNKRIGWTKARLSTRELVERTHRMQKVQSPCWYRVAFAKPLQMPHKRLPIQPYTLGAWLGDGTSKAATIGNNDDQLWARIEAEGHKISHDHCAKDNCQVRTIYGLLDKLRQCGLANCTSRTKHIPHLYLSSSLEQRTNLIQGLMDTDGSITDRGDYVYTTISEQLSRDVAELLKTLGVLPNVNPYEFIKDGEPYVYYKVQFAPCAEIEFFSLDYHKERIRKKGRNIGERFWFIKDVHPAPTVKSHCIQVEGGRYIVGENNIPTHNSTIITYAGAIQAILQDPEETIAIFAHVRNIAKAFLAQIKRELEGNEFLKELFPDVLWDEPRRYAPTWSLDAGLIVKRDSNPKEASFEAHGLVDGQPTSRHYGLRIYDDTVSREAVTTGEQIQKTTEAFDLSQNLASSRGARMWMVGTRYSFSDTYHTIMERGMIQPRIHAATDDGSFDGNPVFLTQQEWDDLKNSRTKESIACQQLQNPLMGSNKAFDPEWIQWWEVRPHVVNIYIMFDPAKTKNRNADRSAMMVVAVDSHRNKYLVDGAIHRMSLSERWVSLRNMRKKWLNVPGVQLVKVGYEKFSAQADLEYFEEQMEAKGAYFKIHELAWAREGSSAKEDRIQRLEPDFRNGRFYFPRDNSESFTKLQLEAETTGKKHLVSRQIKKINEEGKGYDIVDYLINNEYIFFPNSINDDGLDALSRIYDMEPSPPIPMSYRKKLTPDEQPDY